MGNQFQVRAKPLIQIVLPEWEDVRGTRFVFSSETTPDYGQGGISVRDRIQGSWCWVDGVGFAIHLSKITKCRPISLSGVRVVVTPVPVDRLLAGV